MKGRLLLNDIKSRPLLTVTTWLFMTVSAFLFALTAFLATGLLGAMDNLMTIAKTPDFLQMHGGYIDEDEIERFAKDNDDVISYQVLGFLNLDNSSIYLSGHSLVDSTQDNGVSEQSESFDFLVDLNNEIIRDIKEGEICIPVCYKDKYDLNLGDIVEINNREFTIVSFLRDSQMNAMMSSSKRFLVSESDYNLLKENGSEEYLIEFLLREDTNTNVFTTKYMDASLPSNGPTITKSLIYMMNALSDGMMIMVILLISVVLLLISLLCIRFTLLTELEGDRREIGMLKAIGIPKKDIRGIYGTKFIVLSGLGALSGLALAFLIKDTLSSKMQELYGAPEKGWLGILAAILGVVITEGIIMVSVMRTLKHTEKISAVEALTGRDSDKKKTVLSFSQHFIVVLVIALGVFLMILPQNIMSTLSSPKFVTYMGIGNGELRIDLRQTDDIEEKTKEVEELLICDERVSDYSLLETYSTRVLLDDGTYMALLVEEGDHSVFPLTYSQGNAPMKEGEIALSSLSAEELGLRVGDKLYLMDGDENLEYRVSGIYSDITNGGKTAKATFVPKSTSPMWSVFYLSLISGESKSQWLDDFSALLSEREINAKAVDILEYVKATYIDTIREIEMASNVSLLVSLSVMMVVVILFTKLLVTEERNDISLRKAIGFVKREIKGLYYLRYLPKLIVGIVLGVISGNFLGEIIAGVFLKSLGATGFKFILDLKTVYVFIPILALIAVSFSVYLGLSEIKHIKAYECCIGKE